MVQKIHPQGVIWVQSSRLRWENQLKKLKAVPSIYKEVHGIAKALLSNIVGAFDREQRFVRNFAFINKNSWCF